MKTVQGQVEHLLCGLSPLATNRFMHWLLVDPEQGVVRFAADAERPAIEAVASLHVRAINGDVVLDKEWAAARAAAWDAAWPGAWAAARDAAGDAAWDAARAAAWEAAWAAAWDVAWDAAWEAASAAAWPGAWAAARAAAWEAAWAAAWAAAWDAAWAAAWDAQLAKLKEIIAEEQAVAE